MSQVILEERVGALEGDVSRLRTDVAVLGRDVSDIKLQSTTILTAITDLKTQNASRPAAPNYRAVGATTLAIAAGLGTVGTFVWWFIGASPAIEDLRQKIRDVTSEVRRLDDPEIGKVPRMEREFGRWVPIQKQANK